MPLLVVVILVGMDRFLQYRNARYWRWLNLEKDFSSCIILVQRDRSKCHKFLGSEKSNGSDVRDVIFFNSIFCSHLMSVIPISLRKSKKEEEVSFSPCWSLSVIDLSVYVQYKTTYSCWRYL